MTHVESPVFTIAQAAQYLACSAGTVKKLMRSGSLRYARIAGSDPRILRADLDALIAGRLVGGAK